MVQAASSLQASLPIRRWQVAGPREIACERIERPSPTSALPRRKHQGTRNSPQRSIATSAALAESYESFSRDTMIALDTDGKPAGWFHVLLQCPRFTCKQFDFYPTK